MKYLDQVLLLIGVILLCSMAHANASFNLCTEAQEIQLNSSFTSEDVDVVSAQIALFEVLNKCTYNPLERILHPEPFKPVFKTKKQITEELKEIRLD